MIQLGDTVKHNTTEKVMTVVKLGKYVATCQLDEKDFFKVYPDIANSPIIKVNVCLIKNLTKI